MEYLLSKMSWPEVKEALKVVDTVLIPVGSTEQHGLHLPVDNDHYTSFEISKRVAERLRRGKIDIIVCPPLPYGISPHHMDFPGTISLRIQTFIDVLADCCRSMIQHGFKNVVIINGHGGNVSALQTLLIEMDPMAREKVFVVNWWEVAQDAIKRTCNLPISHACEAETSVALALEQRVMMDKAKGTVLQESTSQRHRFPRMIELTDTGALGEPKKAGKKKGETIVEAAVEGICELLEQIER